VIDFDSSVTTETYTLSSTSNRLTSVADGSVMRSLTYDASGNVITDDRGGGTVYTLVYADHNRLAEIKSGSTVLASYAYGAFGRRLVKTAGSTVTQFHFGPGGQPIAETDATGTTNVEFIWLGGLPLARIDGGTISYIHADHLNAPQKITDASKTVLWDGAFTPFGKAHALAGSLTHNHRFPGQHYDAVAGYHQNHFRDYAPSLGRYLQSDPIGLAGGLNTYGYVLGNPQNLIDSDGLQQRRTIRRSEAFSRLGPTRSSIAAQMFRRIQQQRPRYSWAMRPRSMTNVDLADLARLNRSLGNVRPNSATLDYRPQACTGQPYSAAVSLSNLHQRGFQPPAGTRSVPEGLPEGWRIGTTRGEGGVHYYDAQNPGNSVRVMPGNPNSPYPNSQSPYVRWQKNGEALNASGNVVRRDSPEAHIPLGSFRYNPSLFK
jgi:RHS repeat-associated protein